MTERLLRIRQKLRLDQVELPARYRYGFFLGAFSLSLVFLLLMTTPGADRLSSLAPSRAEPLAALVTRGTFSKGVTLSHALQKVPMPPALIHSIGTALAQKINVRSLNAGDAYEIVHSADTGFQELTVTRGLRQYVVSPESAPGRVRVVSRDIPLTTEERSYGGRIAGSLWESMTGGELTGELAMQFSDIFAWNIDFLTEPRAGDRYALVWERDVSPDGQVAQRRIVAALYDGRNTGRRAAVFFNGEFYDERGESLRKAFLAAPLNFRRISSGFSHRRFHPVLRYFRPHLGIDYAAPHGTPVVAIGDGTVVFKGWKTAYGRWVQVRHNGTFTTCYAHFSRYARNLRVGSRVKQGQVIGYVGASGHATGPHLDFRVKKHGKFVNFMHLKIPADKKIPAAQRPEFDKVKRHRLEQLQEALETAGRSSL